MIWYILHRQTDVDSIILLVAFLFDMSHSYTRTKGLCWVCPISNGWWSKVFTTVGWQVDGFFDWLAGGFRKHLQSFCLIEISRSYTHATPHKITHSDFVRSSYIFPLTVILLALHENSIRICRAVGHWIVAHDQEFCALDQSDSWSA